MIILKADFDLLEFIAPIEIKKSLIDENLEGLKCG